MLNSGERKPTTCMILATGIISPTRVAVHCRDPPSGVLVTAMACRRLQKCILLLLRFVVFCVDCLLVCLSVCSFCLFSVGVFVCFFV